MLLLERSGTGRAAVGAVAVVQVPGGDLIAVAADPPVDLMLSDVLLPGGMNGVRLSRELTSRHPGIKLLFMSGYPGAELGENGVAAISPSKLLKKPFQTRDLAQKLRQALDEGEG